MLKPRASELEKHPELERMFTSLDQNYQVFLVFSMLTVLVMSMFMMLMTMIRD